MAIKCNDLVVPPGREFIGLTLCPAIGILVVLLFGGLGSLGLFILIGFSAIS